MHLVEITPDLASQVFDPKLTVTQSMDVDWKVGKDFAIRQMWSHAGLDASGDVAHLRLQALSSISLCTSYI